MGHALKLLRRKSLGPSICPNIPLCSGNRLTVCGGSLRSGGVFPPAESGLGLKKCLRILPHHNDTGGPMDRKLGNTGDSIRWSR